MTDHPVSPAAATADRAAQRRGRRLFGFCLLSLAALLCYFAATSELANAINLYQGLVMLALAALPSLLWARRGGAQLPIFEVLMLTTAAAYALPFLNGNEQLRDFPPEVITQSGFVVLLYQAIAVCTYAVISGRPGTSPFFTTEILSRGIKRYIGYGLVLSTIYTYFSVYQDGLIPAGINSIMRAVFAGIGLVSTFVQARRWGQGDLAATERIALVFLLTLQVIMQFSTLFLIGGIAIIILALVGYVSGGHRVPLVPVFALVALLALLHNGKSVMRAKYWDETGYHQQVEPTALVPFYAEWVQAGLSVRDESEKQRGITQKLLERTSLMHILCLVVLNTPERLPYLDGKTYAQIPGQFVPSFLWPEKPLAHISTSTLSIYYGLQSEEGTLTTTIGFGMLTEAYANFGLFGVGALAFLLGAFYKKVQSATAQSPMLSYPGLFLVVLMAWSFQTEWPMSLWLSSLYQACVGVMGVPFILRNFLGD
jgi:hypothetical protein